MIKKDCNRKILFISNVPSPYCVEYLNELGKYVDVTAVFERRTSTERDKSWDDLNVRDFKCIILNGLKCSADTAFSPGVLRWIRCFKNKDIIIGNPTTPTGIIAIFYCKIKKIDFMLQSEGGIPGSGKGLKEKFKKILMQGAKLYFSGMTPSSDYFLTYGASIENIVHYPFASMHRDELRKKNISKDEKKAEKEKLDIFEKKMVLYVGRFIPEKGIDTLIKACCDIGDVGLYLVGGESKTEYEYLAKKYSVKVHYINHCDFQTLSRYYIAADIFVLPTHSDTWGLVINEAMSFGLPVITTKMCVAGLELIKNDINGYLIDVNDVKKLHEYLVMLVKDDLKRKTMGKINQQIIADHSYEHMAEKIYMGLIHYEKTK